jgi:hypothetical protein
MGLDVADVDNDGWPDVYTTDMLPEDEFRFKTTASFEGWDVYQTKVRNGYHHQAMRNMLQRNNRDGTFTDVGQLAAWRAPTGAGAPCSPTSTSTGARTCS